MSESLMKRVKKLIPLEYKLSINALLSTGKQKKWMKYRDIQGKRIFIFLAGFYQNLGDMAITYAQRDFLQHLYPEAKIILVPIDETYSAVKAIRTYIRPNDLVTVIGGGNMSDMYHHFEVNRRYVVKSFPKQQIISFPQTMIYSDTTEGKKELKKTRRIFAKHPNLTVFARESNSLARMKRDFKDVDVRFAPDIVLSLKKPMMDCARHGLICCLRNDKEKAVNDQEQRNLMAILHNEFDDITNVDTVDVDISLCNEEHFEKALNDFWNQIGHAEVVITDRLHCMIFCVITGTPCIALDNANQKISGVYCDWLQTCDYVELVSSNQPETIVNKMKQLVSNAEKRANLFELKKSYSQLESVCLDNLR